MKRAKDLTREQLEAIVTAVQNQLYLATDDEPGEREYDEDLDINGGDLVEALTRIAKEHGLAPNGVERDYGDYRCQNCNLVTDHDDFVPSDGNPAPVVCPMCSSTECFSTG